jgi:uncharacterized protein (TIGR03067 family)
MRYRVLTALAALAALTGFAPAPLPKPEKKDDLKNMAGHWTAVRYACGRNPVLGKDATLTVKVEGNKWSFFRVTATGTSPSSVYTFTLDPKKEPRWIDYKQAPGTSFLRGIYRFERDQLLVAFHTYDVPDRPTEFGGANGGVYYLTLKRSKP